ncbi:MAG TPA: sulfatase-like hydrolase/transferase, partial [Candidatus Bathyarchaeia archaeon]|nr:sulfatase-like hydrolase/transferase [Candidatus Bathyarchaeia archaeon]
VANLAAGKLDAGAGRPGLDGGRGAERDRRRAENLVLITIDTLRADEAGARNMPRLEGLAATGVKLSSAFASAPWTLPSLASLMTGRSPQSHGAGRPIGPSPLDRSALDAVVPTLATILNAAGFATRAVVTNPYLGTAYGLAQGFSAYENLTLESEAAITLAPTLGGWALERLGITRALGDRGAVVTRRARRFLAQPPGGRFFLWLHYIDPHAPYAGERRSFRGDLLAAAGARTPAARGVPRMAELRAGEVRLPAEGRERLRAAYRAAIAEVDAEIGAVVDALRDAGLSATTLLVVTADHGEEFWDHGGVEHGHSLYDELIHVPLVLACPGLLPAGRVVDTVVGLDRLAATILDLLEVRSPGGEGAAGANGTCGKGIAPGFADLLGHTLDAGETRPVVSENLLFAEERVALRTARYTYVRWPNGKEEVYDRRRDPRELRDLAARRSLVRALARRLDADREPASAAPVCALRKSDDERTRRALQALGYVP